jgi:hypothetical protein
MMRHIIFYNGGGAGNSMKGKGQNREKYKKEVEKCDRLRATLNLVSCAGGSCSGVGSCVMDSY